MWVLLSLPLRTWQSQGLRILTSIRNVKPYLIITLFFFPLINCGLKFFSYLIEPFRVYLLELRECSVTRFNSICPRDWADSILLTSFLFVLFWDGVSCLKFCWPETLSVAEADLEFFIFLPLSSSSWGQGGWQAGTTLPDFTRCWSSGCWTQGLVRAKQVFCQLSYISAIQFLSVCLPICLSLSLKNFQNHGAPSLNFLNGDSCWLQNMLLVLRSQQKPWQKMAPMLSSPWCLQESSYLLPNLF